MDKGTAMTNLGDLYVQVHADTKALRPEVRRAAKNLDAEGDYAGQRFSKGFDKQTKRAMGQFESNFHDSIDKALTHLPDVDIDANPDEAHRKIAALKGELRALNDLKIGVDIDAAGALAHLALVQTALTALTSDDHEIDIKINTKGALGALEGIAAGGLAEVASEGTAATGVLSRMGVVVGGLTAPLAAAGPLMIALAAGITLLIGAASAAGGALGGLALALGAPLAATGAGVGLFAYIAGKYVKDTLEQAKANKTLSESQKELIKDKDKLKGAFDAFTKKNSGALNAPITTAMEKLRDVLQGDGLTQLITSVSDALDRMLSGIDTDKVDHFIGSLSGAFAKGGVFDDIVSSAGSLGGIFGSIFGAGADLGVQAINGMSDALTRFDNYLKSDEGRKQLKEFFNWVEVHGPTIGQDIIDIGVGAYKFLKAVTPAGEAALHFLAALTKIPGAGTAVKVVLAVIVGSFSALLVIIGTVTGAIGGLFKYLGEIPLAPDWVGNVGDGLLGISKDSFKASQEVANLAMGLDKTGKKKVNVPVDADTKNAKKHTDDVTGYIKGQTPKFNVDANTKPAKDKHTDLVTLFTTPLTVHFGSPDLSGLESAFNSFKRRAESWASAFGLASGGRVPPGFAGGGKVPGRTPTNRSFDNVAGITRKGNPIRVQSGEWIINSKASEQNNRLLAAINAGFNAQTAFGFSGGGVAPAKRKEHYADGGRVDSSMTNSNNTTEIKQIFTGPVVGNLAKRQADWTAKYTPRYGTGGAY